MMKYIIMLRSRFERKKGEAIALFLLVLGATIMINVGLTVLLNLDSAIERVHKKNHGSDIFLISLYNKPNEVENVIRQRQEVKDLEINAAILNHKTKIWIENGKYQETSCIFEVESNLGQLSSQEIIYDSGQRNKNTIILPYYLHIARRLNTGDHIIMEVKDKTFDFEIAGFFEDAIHATPSAVASYRMLISQQSYDELIAVTKARHCAYIYRMKLYSDYSSKQVAQKLSDDINTNLSQFGSFHSNMLNYEVIKREDCYLFNIFISILTVFGVVILLITEVIIYFSITDYMNQNRRYTAIMQVVGYTSKQMAFSVMLEYSSIAIVGSFCGTIISVFIIKGMKHIISSFIGVRWLKVFDLKCAFIGVLVVLGVNLLITYFSSRRFKKIGILYALRGGIETHSFCRNYFQLDHVRLSLPIAIGLKNIMNQKKKSVVICIITVILAYTCNWAIFEYNNLTQDKEVLKSIVGVEVPTIRVDIPAGKNPEVIGRKIKRMNGVEYINYELDCRMNIEHDGKKLTEVLNAWESFSKLKVHTLVEGRYPIYDNEIMISRVISEQIGAKVGDYVLLSDAKNKREYLVTGINQHTERVGKTISIEIDALKKMNEEYKPRAVYVYLRDNVQYYQIERKIKKIDPLLTIIEGEKYFSKSFDVITNLIILCCNTFIIIVIIIIILMMYILLRMKISQDKIQIGIDKVVGYTTKEIRLQIMMNYVPIIFVGTIVGGIINYFLVERMVNIGLINYGFQCNGFRKSFTGYVFTTVFLTMLSVFVSVMFSSKIKKIEPTNLIME